MTMLIKCSIRIKMKKLCHSKTLTRVEKSTRYNARLATTQFLVIFDPRSSIVKSVFDCRLHGVIKRCPNYKFPMHKLHKKAITWEKILRKKNPLKNLLTILGG